MKVLSPIRCEFSHEEKLTAALLLLLCSSSLCLAIAPKHTVENHVVRLRGVETDNPILYDNDWWFDVFDNNYLWAQASQNQADLKGNIVSLDMWEWQNGYQYKMEDCLNDARKALQLARGSGLKRIPDLTRGSDQALVRPDSGRIEDTEAHPSDGSRLIIQEARRASPEKPLLVVSGGPLTTVANALLTDPDIGRNLIVFNLTVSSNGYNGKDGWSAYIVAKRTQLVDWATGSFWDKNSVFRAEHFAALPKNQFCNDMRRLIRSDLGQANQLGDGAALVWLWRNDCWRDAELRRAVWSGNTVRFEKISAGEEADVLTIPKSATNLDASREEFFRVLTQPDLFP